MQLQLQLASPTNVTQTYTRIRYTQPTTNMKRSVKVYIEAIFPKPEL